MIFFQLSSGATTLYGISRYFLIFGDIKKKKKNFNKIRNLQNRKLGLIETILKIYKVILDTKKMIIALLNVFNLLYDFVTFLVTNNYKHNLFLC